MLENISLHSSKLHRLFSLLDKAELRQFELWLSSPLHNSLEENKQLYLILLAKRIRKQPINKLDLLEAIEKLPKSNAKSLHPSEDKRLRKAMHNLCCQLEDFLTWKESQKRPNQSKRLLMDSLMWRKCYDLLPKLIKQMKRNLNKTVQQNHRYAQEIFLLQEISFYQHMIQQNRDPNDNLQEVMGAYRQLFLGKFLLYEAAAIDRSKILNKEYDHKLLPYIEAFLSAHPDDLEQPLIKAFYHILLFIKGEKADYHFDSLKDYLLTDAFRFDSTDLRMISNFLLNYCNRQIKQGRSFYRQKKHEIYCLGVKHEIWSAGIYFSKTLFIQIIHNALKLKEFEWAGDFILKRGQKLAPKHQAATILFTQSLNSFSQGDYLTAKQLIPPEKRETDLFDTLVYKILSLKIDFETLGEENNDSLLNSKLGMIYGTIKRDKKLSKSKQKMTPRLHASYANFAKFFLRIKRRMEKPKGSLSADNIRKLRLEIEATDHLEERDWLLEKVERL